MKLTPIPAEKVDSVWPAIRDKIERACTYSRGLETAEGIRGKVKSGNGFILVLIDDDTPIVFERGESNLHILTICGSGIVRRFDDFVSACFLVAGYVGCKSVSWNGRKGWDKLAAHLGIIEGDNGYKEVMI